MALNRVGMSGLRVVAQDADMNIVVAEVPEANHFGAGDIALDSV